VGLAGGHAVGMVGEQHLAEVRLLPIGPLAGLDSAGG
jgi:hypothetical protein